jgi:hypothetical protein
MTILYSKTATDLRLRPPQWAEAGKIAGNLKVKTESWCESATSSGPGYGPVSIDDVMMMFRVNSSEIPVNIFIIADRVSTVSCFVEIDIYEINGGPFVKRLASLIHLTETGTTYTNAPLELSAVDPINIPSHAGAGLVARIWQHLGLTSDPRKDYDFALNWPRNTDLNDWRMSLVYQYVDEG